jgi:hypothetical protein
MTHRGGLCLSIIIWRRGVASFLLPWGPKNIFPALNRSIIHKLKIQPVKYMINSNKVTKGRIIRIPQLSTCLFVTGPGALSRLTPLSVALLLLPCTLMDILSLFTRCCSWKQVTGHDQYNPQIKNSTGEIYD